MREEREKNVHRITGQLSWVEDMSIPKQIILRRNSQNEKEKSVLMDGENDEINAELAHAHMNDAISVIPLAPIIFLHVDVKGEFENPARA